MLSLFRRAFRSWVVLALLGLIAVAVVVTGVGTPNGLGGGGAGANGERIATIGKDAVGADDLAQAARRALQANQQNNTGLDMPAFVAANGVERTADELIASRALEQWARGAGFVASDRLIDGDIASIAAFRDPTGKFDQNQFRQALAQQRISETQLRREMAGDIIRRQLIGPVGGGASAPIGMVLPYASLLLEVRRGLIGFVPSAAIPAGPPPGDAEVAIFYKAHLAAYSLPERRVFRYAVVGPQQVKTTPPTEAEIAAAYKKNAAGYAAVETRTLSQVILPDEAAAKALKAKIAGGQSFAAAAQAAGFAAADTAVGKRTRTAFAELASPAAAAAAFALPQGGVSDPVKSPLGWHVVRVDAVETTAAKPLDAVRATIAADLAKQKADEGLADLVAAIDDAVAGGSTFDDVIKQESLTAQTTPPVTLQGAAPGVAGWTPPPELAPVLKAGFDADTEDDPTVESLGPGKPSVLLKLDRIVAAAPVPFAQARDAVLRDMLRERAFVRAKGIADGIAAKADAGTALAQAFAETELHLPAPERAGGRQADLARAKGGVPPPLALMFSMAERRTRTIPAPQAQGWFVVHLDTIERGDARKVPALINATRQQFARVLGEEYADQFVRAAAAEVRVTRDTAAIARVRTALAGGAPTPQ